MKAIRPKKLAEKWHVDRSTLWRWERTIPGFPRKYRLGPNVVCFDEDEADRYAEQTLMVRPSEIRDRG